MRKRFDRSIPELRDLIVEVITQARIWVDARYVRRLIPGETTARIALNMLEMHRCNDRIRLHPNFNVNDNDSSRDRTYALIA
jgi:hypothetical protein